jgi:hypothetical protein
MAREFSCRVMVKMLAAVQHQPRTVVAVRKQWHNKYTNSPLRERTGSVRSGISKTLSDRGDTTHEPGQQEI